jgi:hypothetical protein
MYTTSNVHTKIKKDNQDESNQQHGSGEISPEKNTESENNGDNGGSESEIHSSTLKDLLSKSKPLSNQDDPITFNAKKRKLLGGDIQDSFLHPSFVKTSKIMVNSNKSLEKLAPKNKNKSEKKEKDIKHKFKFD